MRRHEKRPVALGRDGPSEIVRLGGKDGSENSPNTTENQGSLSVDDWRDRVIAAAEDWQRRHGRGRRGRR